MKKYPDLTSLNISLTRDQREYVAERVAEGGYGTASEFVRDLIRNDARDRSRLELERQLLEGLDSGTAAPFSASDFDRLRQRVQRARAGAAGKASSSKRKKRRRSA